MIITGEKINSVTRDRGGGGCEKMNQLSAGCFFFFYIVRSSSASEGRRDIGYFEVYREGKKIIVLESKKVNLLGR